MRIVRYTHPGFRAMTPSLAFPRSAWSGLETEIDRLFETALDGIGVDHAAANRFAVDLFEDKDNTYVRAELPGLNRNDINVEIVDGYLTISAERKNKSEKGENEASFSFTRSISIPDDVRTDAVGASYEHGILTVTLPKREEAKPKKITVAVK